MMVAPFTCVGGRGLGIVKRRLDRCLCSPDFNYLYTNIKVCHLPRMTSDHSPLLLKCVTQHLSFLHSFRFLNGLSMMIFFHMYSRFGSLIQRLAG